jgi:hypothetical protein
VTFTVSSPAASAPAPAGEPLAIRDDSPRLHSPHKEARSGRAIETYAFCGILVAASVAAIVYAVQVAQRPAPAAPVDVVEIHVPAPAAPPPPILPQPRLSRTASTVPSTPAKAEPPKVADRVVIEPETPARPPVDPIAGFDSGAAFDNPTQPGRSGRRGAGTFNNPVHGPISNFENPTHGPSSTMAPRANQPNTPDPSFRNPR